MLDPGMFVHEMHLFFTVWKKILGHNYGVGRNYFFQLSQYHNKCEHGIPYKQLGRIHDVRQTGDSKPNGDYFLCDKNEITFIRSTLPSRNEEMKPYEEVFNNFSKELRKRIHITKDINPEEIVGKQLDVVEKLSHAHEYLLKSPEEALDKYQSLLHLINNQRTITLEGVILDNFSLETLIGLRLAQCGADKSEIYEKYIQKQDLTRDAFSSWDFNSDEYRKERIVSKMLWGIEFEQKGESIITEKWKYSYKDIMELCFSSEEGKDSYMVPLLMLSLRNERNAIYSPKTINLLLGE